MNRVLEKDENISVACKIKEPVRFLSNGDIKLHIEKAQRGDMEAFDRVFINFLPHICRTAQASGLEGIELLNMIGKMEERLREVLVYAPIFGRTECRYYRILIKDFISEEIIKSGLKASDSQSDLGGSENIDDAIAVFSVRKH